MNRVLRSNVRKSARKSNVHRFLGIYCTHNKKDQWVDIHDTSILIPIFNVVKFQDEFFDFINAVFVANEEMLDTVTPCSSGNVGFAIYAEHRKGEHDSRCLNGLSM